MKWRRWNKSFTKRQWLPQQLPPKLPQQQQLRAAALETKQKKKYKLLIQLLLGLYMHLMEMQWMESEVQTCRNQ